MERVGIYPGTFDPITLGHMDVVEKALAIVDKLIIAVAEDIPKTPIFSVDERAEMVRESVVSYGDRVEVQAFSGLLVNIAKQHGASVIIRGLRAVSDFEYEFQLAAMNAKLDDSIQTVFLPASENNQFVASKFVKEIARLGGEISEFVTPEVEKRLKAYYA